MKFSAAILATVVSVAAAGSPQLSISVRDGNFDGLDGLDPTLRWSDSTTAGDMDVSYGIEARAVPTADIASLPKSIWGKASTNVAGWGVSGRAEIEGLDYSNADLDINADNGDADLSVRLQANAGDGINVRSVEATKGFDSNGNRVTVTPRFNLEDDSKDVVVNYSTGNTAVKLTASADAQEVTVSQQIDDDNRVAPTVNSNGDISVEWERRLTDDSSLTATLKPDDSVNVEWKDSAWTANVNMPISGTNIKGANVGIKRDVAF